MRWPEAAAGIRRRARCCCFQLNGAHDFWWPKAIPPENTLAITQPAFPSSLTSRSCDHLGHGGPGPRERGGRKASRRAAPSIVWVPRPKPPSRGSKNFRMSRSCHPERVTPPPRCHSIRPWPGRRWRNRCGARSKHGASADPPVRHGRIGCSPTSARL